MDGRIAFIVTSSPIKQAVQLELDNMSLQFPVVEVTMDEVLGVASQYVEKGAKVIVCNGSMAMFLKNRLRCYIVEILYSSVELIAAVKEGLTYSDKIAVVGYESLVQACRQIQPLFDMPLHVEQVFRDIDMESTVQRLTQSGFRVFVGGSKPVNAARKAGAVGICIDINLQNIRHAIQEGIRLLELQDEKDAHYELTNSILNCVSEGVIGVDRRGRVSEINANALRLLQAERAEAVGRSLRELLPGVNIDDTLAQGAKRFGEVFKTTDNLLSVNCVPIAVSGEITGAVLTLQESRQIQNMEFKIRQKTLARGHVARKSMREVLGKSRLMTETKRNAMTFAQTDSTVLLIGETGTGKEVFAQSIHNASRRANQPFVAINCASLPESLLESTLFGYVKGAFTGANPNGKAGLFEMAHTGTIFLDEISELTLSSQTRLLRVLQEKEVFRLGDDKVIPVNIRVIAATNKDLYQLVNEGKFREDLYFRLTVLILNIPALRKRKEDLDEHANHIVREKGLQLGRCLQPLSREMLDLLHAYDWPGNIRELENVLERAIVMSAGDRVDMLSEVMHGYLTAPGTHAKPEPEEVRQLVQIEDDAIHRALAETDGNKARAAKKLGISPSTLWRKLKKRRSEDADG